MPDGDQLDLVATFRKLELSFWWVVNMLELGALLRWAARQDNRRRRSARRVTFFAALAEWKNDPEASFITALDALSLDALVELVLGVNSGEEEARRQLITLLEDKINRTNDANIDHSGLERLANVVQGIVRSTKPITRQSPITPALSQALAAAVTMTRAALEDREQRAHALLERAKGHVRDAIGEIVRER